MRLTTKLLAAAAAVVFASATAAPQASATSTHASVPAVNVLAIPAPIVSVVRAATQDAKIEVKTTETHSGAWYTQPVWIAIGVIALVLIIVLIISAGRRDTTVIK